MATQSVVSGVGALVGCVVGDADGCVVGESVGCAVGGPVGCMLGGPVGCAVGDAVGLQLPGVSEDQKAPAAAYKTRFPSSWRTNVVPLLVPEAQTTPPPLSCKTRFPSYWRVKLVPPSRTQTASQPGCLNY